LTPISKKLISLFTERQLTLALAESCTGGLVAASLSSVPGASNVLWGSFVTYTIDAKCKMLGIERALIEEHGAVSAETARAMARGALEKSGADIAASVTGLAGPDGDGSDTPVGTVFIAVAQKDLTAKNAKNANNSKVKTMEYHFTGSREEVRSRAVETVLETLIQGLSRQSQ
jgi:PncC family amidohydrolase